MRLLSNKVGIYLKQHTEKAKLDKCQTDQQLPGFDSTFWSGLFLFLFEAGSHDVDVAGIKLCLPLSKVLG